MARGYHDSNTPEEVKGTWRTPRPVYLAMDEEFHFIADVAASAHNALHPVYITEEMDALDGWHHLGPGIVWCNPPYDDLLIWVEIAADCCARGTGCVMLVPADISTEWWRVALDSVSEVRMITRGRLSFLHPVRDEPAGGGKSGSAFLIWDPNNFPNEVVTRYVDRDILIKKGEQHGQQINQ